MNNEKTPLHIAGEDASGARQTRACARCLTSSHRFGGMRSIAPPDAGWPRIEHVQTDSPVENQQVRRRQSGA